MLIYAYHTSKNQQKSQKKLNHQESATRTSIIRIAFADFNIFV